MQVSVIITAYNCEDVIGRAVESVLKQSYEVHEVICVDDSSSDRTYDVLLELERRCPSVNVIRLPRNSGGPSIPRNVGIVQAEGDFVAFLDGDDSWESDRLEKQIAVARRTGAKALCSYYIVRHDTGSGSIVRAPDKISYQDMLKKCWVGSPTGLISMDLIVPFKDMPHEDYDFWLTVSKCENIICVPQVLGVHYRRKESRSSHLLSNIRKIGRIIRRHEPLLWPYFLIIYCFHGVTSRFRIWTKSKIG